MMTNLGRIPKILDEVQALWIRHPELRFLQLMMIISERAGIACGKDSFYVDDEELLGAGLDALWEGETG